MRKYPKILPSLAELAKVGGKIKHLPNQSGEYKRKIHYGCYLLCSQSGLRISEAIKFDLNTKTHQGLYRITKTKGQKERLVYISPQVIHELKKQHWKPHQTNRFTFYHFLRKIKRELNISSKIELTPHTFRRAFATYHAHSGMPLPLLQKLLGHSSIRTTALYWQNIYGNDDPTDILAGKKWLARPNSSQRPKSPQRYKSPPRPNSSQNRKNPPPPPRNSEPIIRDKPPTQPEQTLVNFNKLSANSLLTAQKEKNPPLTNYQPKLLNHQISPPNQANFSLNTSEPSPLITSQQILLTKIQQLEQQLAQLQKIPRFTELLNKSEMPNRPLKLMEPTKPLKALISPDQATKAQTLQPLPFKPSK